MRTIWVQHCRQAQIAQGSCRWWQLFFCALKKFFKNFQFQPLHPPVFSALGERQRKALHQFPVCTVDRFALWKLHTHSSGTFPLPWAILPLRQDVSDRTDWKPPYELRFDVCFVWRGARTSGDHFRVIPGRPWPAMGQYSCSVTVRAW